MNGRALCVIVLSLAAAGCVTPQDWTVEDWDLSYKDCEIKLDWDSGKVKCKWKVSWLGT